MLNEFLDISTYEPISPVFKSLDHISSKLTFLLEGSKKILFLSYWIFFSISRPIGRFNSSFPLSAYGFCLNVEEGEEDPTRARWSAAVAALREARPKLDVHWKAGERGGGVE